MTTIRDARDIHPDDKIIAIMGPTGSGKSNLIDALTQKTKWSGNNLLSETQNVRAIRVKSRFQGLTGDIVFVDTPGFDDTTRSDMEILKLISNWLKETYKRGVKLTGILYLHRISDKRMSGTPYRNLRMLGKLCGSDPARILVFVTTMWDTKPADRFEEREKDLQTHYFKRMVDLGADTARFKNTSDSAWQIISRLLALQEERKVTLIQEEMVVVRRDLPETKAAEELLTDLQKILTAHKQTIEALKHAAKKADNQEMMASLDKELAENRKEMEKTLREVQKLKIPLFRRFARFLGRNPKQKDVELGGK